MKRNKTSIIVVILTAILWGGVVFTTHAAPLKNLPITLKQPNGETIYCFSSGDEFHNWFHDENGFTIIQHPQNGYYVYAEQDGENVKASDFIVGQVDPANVGLNPNVNISERIVSEKRKKMLEKLEIPIEQKKEGIHEPVVTRKKSGEALSNIVIFVQFSDENITTEDASFYEDLYLNEHGPSLIHYYQQVTNDQLTLQSTFLPQTSSSYVVWFTDENPRAYYQPYNETTNPEGFDPDATSGSTSRTYREHNLLANAIEAVKEDLPSDFQEDANGDGYVDCVSFIVSGEPDGWSDLLWPHRWSLHTKSVYIRGKRVWDYTFQLQYSSSNDRIRLGTVAHEMFHVIGAPDLYRYENSNITPVGIWDIMASTTTIPQQMTAYMKYLYGGWIDEIPEITQTGIYQLSPLQSGANSCYKIPSPNTHTEYFVAEYRTNSYEYDSSLPGSGMLLYRINDRLRGVGNADGPPDELYIYRPGGTMYANGNINNAYFSLQSGRTIINSTTSPSPFLSDGAQGGIEISDIGNAGESISFYMFIDYDIPRGISHYKPSGQTSVGSGEEKTFSVAAKFEPSDLEAYVGGYLTKFEFVITSGGGSDVTAYIWEGSLDNAPGTVAYQKSIASEVNLDDWTLITLEQSIEIKEDTDYWIGYEIAATGGYPATTDRGPMVEGKGGWIKWDETWNQITDLNANLDYNFLIGGVVQKEGITSLITNNRMNGSLSQNYPNPFNSYTTINYSIETACDVSLIVFNALGQKVSTIFSGKKEAGSHSVEFNAKHLSPGIYFYQLQLDGGYRTATKRMIITK